MATQSKKMCSKCGRVMSEVQFYSKRNGEKMDMCKSCLTMHVNNFKPETFTWILERMDIPYVEVEWNVVRDKVFAKNPKKMNGTSVLGRYLAKMRLTQFKDKGWADSETLNEQAIKRKELKAEQEQNEKEQIKKDVEKLKASYQKGEIGESEFKTLMDIETLNEEYLKQKAERQKQVVDGNTPVSELTPSIVGGSENYYNEANFIPEDNLIDLGAELTEEDKVYLAMKWGRLYKPSEWVELERKYTEMKDSFDIQDSDTEGSLVLTCKTYLKMNQAIDTGDMDGYQKLSRVYDNLRKSAKFTAAQNKDTTNNFIDSLGEMVAYCEEHGGAIPRYEITTPQDVIDKVIQDMKNYNRSLVYEDTALARQIEDYLKKRENADKKEKDRLLAKLQGKDYVEISDEDYKEYFEKIENEKEQDTITKGEVS